MPYEQENGPFYPGIAGDPRVGDTLASFGGFPPSGAEGDVFSPVTGAPPIYDAEHPETAPVPEAAPLPESARGEAVPMSRPVSFPEAPSFSEPACRDAAPPADESLTPAPYAQPMPPAARPWMQTSYTPPRAPSYPGMFPATPDPGRFDGHGSSGAPGRPVDPFAVQPPMEPAESAARPAPKPKKTTGWRNAFLALALVFVLLAGLITAGLFSLDLSFQKDEGGNWHLVSGDRETPASPAVTSPAPTPDNRPDGEGVTMEIQNPPADTSNAPAAGSALTVAQIVEKNMKSVVGITVTDEMDRVVSSATGIVMSADGYIITNNHVVEGALKVNVIFDDGTTYVAEDYKSDRITDLAVVKINATGLTPAEFGNSDALKIGDPAVVIGNPMGMELQNTVTNGIISAINRDVLIDERTMTMLQTNCAINPGNSGGPLFNEYGQVVGIISSKIMGDYMSSYSVEGLGFAIPINSAKPVIDELISRGYVKGRLAIGIEGMPVDANTSRFYGVPEGLQITWIHPGSDAAAQGLSLNDIITHVNGTKVSTVAEINEIKGEFSVGDSLAATVFRPRTGETVTITFKLMDEGELYAGN